MIEFSISNNLLQLDFRFQHTKKGGLKGHLFFCLANTAIGVSAYGNRHVQNQ